MIYLFAGIILLIALFFAAAYVAYRITFAVPDKEGSPFELSEEEQYASRREEILKVIEAAVKLPYRNVHATTPDGLQLYGRLYETDPAAPTQILFHGYRSHALRDFSGGLQLALKCGCNALLVDQRAHGKSGGRCLSFGILESRDCLTWIQYVKTLYGTDAGVILTGISMGAATVLMAAGNMSERNVSVGNTTAENAAGNRKSENVIGIIADCGYSSPGDIIRKVIKDLHYPARVTYALVRMGGRIYGGFDIEKHSVTEALRTCEIPVLFIHGEDDRFVPCEMTRQNYEACAGEKYLLTVPGAGHGLSYLVDAKRYAGAVKKFLNKIT